MLKPRRILLFATALFVLSAHSASASQNATEVAPPLDIKNGIWVWADYSNDQHAIFLNEQDNEEWGSTIKLTDNEAVNVVPAVSRTSSGKIFVVWSAFKDGEAQLHYKISNGKSWGEEKIFYSGLTSNTAPAICIDDNGVTWLAWAGFNGVNDEIYYTNNKTGDFVTARPITDNNVPDILPVLGIDDETGLPWLEWQQFSADGYVTYEAAWNGSEWSEPTTVSTEETDSDTSSSHAFLLNRTATQGTTATDSEEVEIEIPEFVSSLDSASLHIPGYGVQSLPVRNMKVIE